jgi:hypothetical protein
MESNLAVFDKIEAGFAELKANYSHAPDCSTTKGLEQCKKDYRAVRKVETAIENERLEQGKAAQSHLKEVKKRAESLDSRAKEISEPFKTARDEREIYLKEQEQIRVDGIKERILNIALFINEAHNTNSEGVSAIIESIDLIDCADNFDEFTAEALKTKQDVLEQLGQILQQKSQAEAAERDRLAAEQGRLEAERKAAIDQRINTLRMTPIDFMNKTSKEISAKIDSLKSYVIPAEDFGDRYNEAVGAQSQVIEQLGMALQQAVKLEEAEELRNSQAEFDSRTAEAETSMGQKPEVAENNQDGRNYIKEVADSIEYAPVADRLFKEKEFKTSLDTFDGRQQMEWFFGDEEMGEMATDYDTETEYSLEVIVRRVAIK